MIGKSLPLNSLFLNSPKLSNDQAFIAFSLTFSTPSDKTTLNCLILSGTSVFDLKTFPIRMFFFL